MGKASVALRDQVAGPASSRVSIAELVARCRVAEAPARWLDSFASVAARGNLEILDNATTALFCSTACPASVLLQALDHTRDLRDRGVTVISGFHSPVERECLTILLRGSQPLVICPARGLEAMRMPAEWREPLQQHRLLMLSPFGSGERRVSASLAETRNEFVLALAKEVWLAYIAPGGCTVRLACRAEEWGKRLVQ